MGRFGKVVCVAMLLTTGMAPSATAQTLWLASESEVETKIHCFLRGVEDRAELIDKISATRIWRTTERKKCEPLILNKAEDSLQLSAEDEGLGSTYWLSHDFGMSEVDGKADRIFLHAKAQTSADPSTWKHIGNHKHLPVEIVPKREQLQHRFTVYSMGRPLAKATVKIVGPDLFHHIGTADENGEVAFEMSQSGIYGLCVKSVVSENGKLNGRTFDQTVHVSTLTLPLEVVPVMRLTTK